jgi:hypothetical protein
MVSCHMNDKKPAPAPSLANLCEPNSDSPFGNTHNLRSRLSPLTNPHSRNSSAMLAVSLAGSSFDGVTQAESVCVTVCGRGWVMYSPVCVLYNPAQSEPSPPSFHAQHIVIQEACWAALALSRTNHALLVAAATVLSAPTHIPEPFSHRITIEPSFSRALRRLPL